MHMQVVSRLCKACALVVAKLPGMSKAEANSVLAGALPKLADAKIKSDAEALMTALAEVRCSLSRADPGLTPIRVLSIRAVHNSGLESWSAKV